MKWYLPLVLLLVVSGCYEPIADPTKPKPLPVDPVKPALSPLTTSLVDTMKAERAELALLARTVAKSVESGELSPEAQGQSWNLGSAKIAQVYGTKMRDAIKAAQTTAGLTDKAAQAAVWVDIAKGYEQ